MALNIGRRGWLGVASEASFAVPVAATDFIPFTSNSIHTVQEAIPDVTARGSREKNYGSVIGKQWGEGDVEFNLDTKVIGYFLKSAFGNITTTTPAGSVKSNYFTRSNLNSPASLTLTNDRVVDRQYVRGAVVDTLEIKWADAFATVKAGIKGYDPLTTTSGSGLTLSGTQFSFKDAVVKFGATVSGITGATPATKVNDFTITVKNNAMPTFRSGSNDPATIDFAEFECDGDYTLFFENTTDRDNYAALTKQAFQVVFTGNGIGSGLSESLTFSVYQFRYDQMTYETGLANFYAEKVKWIAESGSTGAGSGSVDATLVNTTNGY